MEESGERTWRTRRPLMVALEADASTSPGSRAAGSTPSSISLHMVRSAILSSRICQRKGRTLREITPAALLHPPVNPPRCSIPLSPLPPVPPAPV